MNLQHSTRHTYDYGLVGNCAFMAHIGKDTNVAWMCWPRFDSSFIFGGLMDEEKGGEFSIKPKGEDFSSHQYYVDNTNVLVTEIENEEGKYRVTDFAPRFIEYERQFRPLMLIRKLEAIAGTPMVNVNCHPKGQYGKVTPKVHRGSNHIKYLGLEEEIRLTTNVPLTYIIEDQYFILNETKYLVLTYGTPLEAPLQTTVENFLYKTERYWRSWIKSTSISEFFQSEVIRSALVLKIHQYEDTGAIIAASTTSLPESPGSGRNWDYRFCWLRDTFYTLTAFNHIGHFEEMEKYFSYVANISAGEEERYQPLYSISGGKDLVEEITDLAGYRGNVPVRVGNQAYEHIQNDVYGQVLISLLPLYYDRRFMDSDRTGSLQLAHDTLDKIEKTIDEPDAGLWEFRDFQQDHCYTYLFQWAGSSAALKISKARGHEPMAHKARRLMDKAAEKIEACYDPERKVYTQAVGQPNLDASTLQLIMMGYLDPDGQRAKDHLIAIEKELKTSNGLMYRYKHTDDFGEPESTFLICAFWYVEALACVGRIEEAVEEFKKLVPFANHLGLLSEDIDEKTGSQWGNFPQAYSHVGLVNAAYRIARKMDTPNFIDVQGYR